MLDLLQHAALVVGVLHLLHLDDLGLLQDLDGVEALVVLGLDEMHTTKGAGAECSLYGEIIEGVFALGGADRGRRGLLTARGGHSASVLGHCLLLGIVE